MDISNRVYYRIVWTKEYQKNRKKNGLSKNKSCYNLASSKRKFLTLEEAQIIREQRVKWPRIPLSLTCILKVEITNTIIV